MNPSVFSLSPAKGNSGGVSSPAIAFGRCPGRPESGDESLVPAIGTSADEKLCSALHGGLAPVATIAQGHSAVQQRARHLGRVQCSPVLAVASLGLSLTVYLLVKAPAHT